MIRDFSPSQICISADGANLYVQTHHQNLAVIGETLAQSYKRSMILIYTQVVL